MKYYQFNRISLSLSFSLLCSHQSMIWWLTLRGWNGIRGKKINKKTLLTEYLYSDGRLSLLVPVGGDALVRPFILIPGIIQCEDRRWLIIEGDCDVWSVRFYPVPTRSEPFYLLGDAYNWENKQEQGVKYEASDIEHIQPLHHRPSVVCVHAGDRWLRFSTKLCLLRLFRYHIGENIIS